MIIPLVKVGRGWSGCPKNTTTRIPPKYDKLAGAKRVVGRGAVEWT